MKKRIYLILIAILMALACLAIPAFAEEANTETLNIVAKNLSFRDSVCIKFAVDTKNADTKLLVWSEEAASKLTKDGFTYGTQTATLSTVGYDSDLGKNYLIYDYTWLSAKEMTDVVYARAYLNGEYGELEKYSILQYAFNMLGKTGENAIDEKLANLINATLAQGAAAQEYFNYKTDRLATAKFYQITVVGGTLADGFNSGLFLEGETVTLDAPRNKCRRSALCVLGERDR